MKKSNGIDTLRLRALHTACMTVDEIAEKMGVTVENVEYELKKMGYTPLYKRNTPERYGFIKKEENNMPKGKKTPVEKVHKIGVLRDEGKSLKKIAEITGVSFSTVKRVCEKVGKAETKEEPAPSANDTSSKKETVPTNIVPEIPADVNPADEISDENFCCEVTGDTDMGAYLADREKIKGRWLPIIVWEACMEKMEELNSRIKAAQDDIAAWYGEISEISAFIAANSITTAEEVRQ